MFFAVAALVALLAVPAHAQVTTPGSPKAVFHGVLDVLPARGRFDYDTGDTSITVRRWRFLPSPDTNGVFPDKEPILIAMGDNMFLLPAGSVVASHHGKWFHYRAPRGTPPPAILSFSMKLRKEGSYGVNFHIDGAEFSRLGLEDGFCVPTAVLIGDDDGFNGCTFTRPGFLKSVRSPRIRIPGKSCIPAEWTWLGR